MERGKLYYLMSLEWSTLTGLPVSLHTYIFIYLDLQAFRNSYYYCVSSLSSVMYTTAHPGLGAQPDSVLVVKFSSVQHSIQLIEELFTTSLPTVEQEQLTENTFNNIS